MDDQHLIRLYSRDQARRGLAESTITARERHFRLLARWLAGKPLDAATRTDIEAFLDTRRLSPRARCRWISDLHCFYNWALLEELVTADPTVRIGRPKLTKLLPRPIGTDDLNAALELAPRVLRCILLLAAYEGMRCIEIARLVREDILDTMEPAVLIARGKGSKARVLPIHPDVWRALQTLPMPRSGRIFRRANGDPMPSWEISRAGNGFLHDLGLDATVHQLRHWFGSETYRTSGHDLLLVRDLLGHAAVTTTEGYAAFDRAGAAEAVRALTAQKSFRTPTVAK